MEPLSLKTAGFQHDCLQGKKLPGSLALKNQVFLSPENFEILKNHALAINAIPQNEPNYANLYGVPLNLKDAEKYTDFCFAATAHPAVPNDRIILNKFCMPWCGYRLDKALSVSVSQQAKMGSLLSVVTIEVKPVRSQDKGKAKDDIGKLQEKISEEFDKQCLAPGQPLIVSGPDSRAPLMCTVTGVQVHSVDGSESAQNRGFLSKKSSIKLVAAKGEMTLSGESQAKQTEAMAIDFQSMGIGGLGKEFKEIFRRAFASRVYPKDIIDGLGIRHVKGILLYGPPGCGKTLIARKIGQALKARPPKIINGPEILNKFVGGSEEKIREQFADAEEEYKKVGDDSELHIIIFDEIDAICKQRGSSRDSTGVGDNVVNQLLAKLDGVEQVNNVLVIGMTNRKDMIDDALLRPGRLEVKVEIGLPDENGRQQILAIHTSKMKDSGFLGPDVSIPVLAGMTKNYTGAEIEGLCKAASAYSLQRQITEMKAREDFSFDRSKVAVTMSDFQQGLKDCPAGFGVKEEDLAKYYFEGIADYGPVFKDLKQTIEAMVAQVRTSTRTPLLSVLLSGDAGSGKSALAAFIAANSGFPFVKMIKAEQFIGLPESQKVEKLRKVFDDASKTPLSLIVLDDIERLLSYVRLGARFSNDVLQALLVLLKQIPSERARRIMIIGTTSCMNDLDGLGIKEAFNVTLDVPNVEPEEITNVMTYWTPDVQQVNVDKIVQSMSGQAIPIKKLLMVLEMAVQKGSVTEDTFQEAIVKMGYLAI
jgi:vesicle-fusing ATPase